MEVVALGDEIVKQLLGRVRELSQALFRISDAVALVDMLAAFAHSVAALNYVRPEIGNAMALKGARHPILDKASLRPVAKISSLSPRRSDPCDINRSGLAK